MGRTLPVVSDASQPLTINQVIAYRLKDARTRKRWTQEEAAEQLTERSAQKWTKATVGAAERSWEGGRVREFDAHELMAFCSVFSQPLAFFFLPPPGTPNKTIFSLGVPVDPENNVRGGVSHFELLSTVLPLGARMEFVGLANDAVNKFGLSWGPSRPTWHHPEEDHQPEEEAQSPETGPADGMSSAAEIFDDAKRRRVLELLTEIRQLMAPEEFPPF